MQRRMLGRVGSVWNSGTGAPSGTVGKDGDLYLNTTNGALYLKTAGSWGGPVAGTVIASLLGSLTTFNQSANSTTLATVPAAVNVGALTLLTDAITAIGTLQTGVNANRQLINQLINILRAAGLAV